MFDVLPQSFFDARRGICPTCGGALDLTGSREQKCSWCGTQSTLERRLIRVDDEPEYELGDDERRDETKIQHTRWLLQEFGGIGLEPVNCPGCGAEFSADTSRRTVRCGHCNTESRVERRLKRLSPETLERPQRRNYQDFVLQRRGKSKLKWDVQTEQLCWRILNERDPDKQAVLAHNVAESWTFTNATLAYFMPWLLALATERHGLVAEYVVQGVGKLLCNEDRALWLPTLQACEQFAFNVHGPQKLLHELGLGKAVCVRLLLDVAEYAWSRGAGEHAVNATWAISTLIDRNFDEHPFIGEVMLHRLYYLSGPVLGWALNKLGSGMGGYLFKDAERLIRFVDALALERPEIAGAVAAPVRHLPTKSSAEYLARLKLLATLKSAAAREACILSLFPADNGREPAAAAVQALEPLLGDAAAGAAAVKALARFIREPESPPAAIESLIERRGESLPERLKVEYHWKFPKTTKLDRKRIVEWQPPKDPPEASEVIAAREAWDKAIRAAVDQRDLRRDALREHKERAGKVEAAIFDAPRDEPPTEPASEPEPSPEPEVEHDAVDYAARQQATLALNARYTAQMAELQEELAKVMARGGDIAQNHDFQRLNAAMQKAINDYMAELNRLNS